MILPVSLLQLRTSDSQQFAEALECFLVIVLDCLFYQQCDAAAHNAGQGSGSEHQFAAVAVASFS